MARKKSKKSKLPRTFLRFAAEHPKLVTAHEKMAKAVDASGPLDAKTCSLIKIGVCVGAGLESALKSHVRRARENGAKKAEVEQAVFQAMNTCGFPPTVAAWAWAQEQLRRGK